MLGAVRAEPSPGRASPAAAPSPDDERAAPVVDGTCDDAAVEELEDALVDGDRTFAPGSARAALRYPVFRRIFAGAFLSNIGTWMQNVVLGALAYDLTESPTFVGVILFAQLGPLLLFSMVGGALADTVDRRRLLICVALTQLVLSFVLAAVAAPDRPDQVVLVGVVFAIGVAQALFNPTYSAMLPQLVGRDDLPGAIALHSAQMNGSRVIGPVIGALLDSPDRRVGGVRHERPHLPVRRLVAAVGAPARPRGARRRPARAGAGSAPGWPWPGATRSWAAASSRSPPSR